VVISSVKALSCENEKNYKSTKARASLIFNTGLIQQMKALNIISYKRSKDGGVLKCPKE